MINFKVTDEKALRKLAEDVVRPVVAEAMMRVLTDIAKQRKIELQETAPFRDSGVQDTFAQAWVRLIQRHVEGAAVNTFYGDGDSFANKMDKSRLAAFEQRVNDAFDQELAPAVKGIVDEHLAAMGTFEKKQEGSISFREFL